MHAIRVLLGLVLALMPLPARADSNEHITVMTRNVYLGADVGPAMELLPNFSAAAEFMWEQVKQTDFSKRSTGLAREIEAMRPDVIALQEATVWVCAPHIWSKKVVVFDFTEQLILALKNRGLDYEIASANGKRAFNQGFSINPIPGLTMVEDSNLFSSIFGTKEAACGFQIADALLVRSEHEVVQVGSTEFEDAYTIIPTFMTVYRGYAWADVKISGNVTRFVATHLESLFDEGEIPVAKMQANQLVQDLQETTMPLVVMGDFNSDPRDPRGTQDPNPGEQPKENSQCDPQVENPTAANALDSCNAYWTMINAGFSDSGPLATDPKNFTWGYDGLLQGSAVNRPGGLTDRLDYIFTKNIQPQMTAQVFGNTFPAGVGVWDCDGNPCAASDHAGIAATLEIPTSVKVDNFLPAHKPFPLGFWKLIGLTILALIVWRVRRRISKNT